ncbi:hypothetical protein BGZ94_000286, partial [Podila epigama]
MSTPAESCNVQQPSSVANNTEISSNTPSKPSGSPLASANPTLTNDNQSTPSEPRRLSATSLSTSSTKDTLHSNTPVQNEQSVDKHNNDQDQDHDLEQHHHHIHLQDLVPSSPVDGGLKGWLAVLGSFLIHCFVFAPTEFVFGIFELHYHDVFPDATSSSIAFVGTTGSAVTYIAGFLSGILADYFGFRGTALTGTVIMTLSLILASFSTQLFGIGASMIYYPGVAVPSQYFNRRRGLAMGIAVSGSGAGGFILAPLTHALIDRLDVFWTLRVLALMILVV